MISIIERCVWIGYVWVKSVEIKEYKIERLWIALENYAKKEGIELKLDVADTNVADVYDLNVTVKGEYIQITDFIYDIEKDDTLGFKILKFKMTPAAITTTTKTETGEEVTVTNYDWLTATFEIKSVGIDFE